MEELGRQIAETIIEQSAKTMGLFPGSFSPATKGHFEVAKRAAQHVDELHIIISNNIREGYTPEVSLKVWKQYLPLLPENVKVKIAVSPSPITEIYNIVKDKTNNYIVIYGKGEKDRYNSINENREKYFNVDIIDAGNFDNMSATSLREAIRTRNKLAIKSLIPEGIKVDDFLLNFQIHEIKVNQPVDFKKLKSRMQEFFKYATETLYPPHFTLKYDGKYDPYIERVNNSSTPEDLYSVIKDMHKAQGLGDGDALDFIELLKSGKENFWLINEIKVNNPSLPSDLDIRGIMIKKSMNDLPTILKQFNFDFRSETFKDLLDRLTTSEKQKLHKQLIGLSDKIDEEKIPGGLASGLTLQDIADKHKANISSLRKQLQKGIKVELEHTTSKDVAEEIATDHLFEDPKYYDKLSTIEKDTLDEIKINKPGILPYDDFRSLIQSVKNKIKIQDIFEEEGYNMRDDSIPRFYERIKNTSILPKLVSIMNGMERFPIEPLDEAKQLGDVYHFTNLNGLQGILQSNSFSGSSTEVDKFSKDFQSFRKKESDFKDKGIEYLNYFSTTRNKNLWKNDPKIGGSLVRIKLDGNKLSNNYKFVPFYYYSDEMDTNNVHPKISQDESEERINLGTKKEIPNAKNYIKEIDIFLDKVGDNTRVLNLIKDLQIKYPQIKTLYKDKEMSVDEYNSKILPTIEPYHDVDESKLLKENIEVNPKLYIQLLDKLTTECCEELGIDKPKIYIINNPKYTSEHKSYAGFIPSTNEIKLVIHGRTLADSCRSLSHEIKHAADASQGLLTPDSGKDNDEAENRANSYAGGFLRKFGRENPNIYFLRYE